MAHCRRSQQTNVITKNKSPLMSCMDVCGSSVAEEALRIIPASGDEPLLSNHLPPQDVIPPPR